MGYIFIILREINVKNWEKNGDIQDDKLKIRGRQNGDNRVENKGKKRLKAKMKRNTAEIRREGRKGFEEEKQGGRIKEKKGNQGRESWTPSLAFGPWLSGKKVHLSFAKCTPCFVLIQDNRPWLFSIVEQYFRKYLESVIITALQNKLLFS